MSYYNAYPVIDYFGPSFIRRISGSGNIIDYIETEKWASNGQETEQVVQPQFQQPVQQQTQVQQVPQSQVPMQQGQAQRPLNPPVRVVYEPPPFGSGDPDSFVSYDSLLPSVSYYSKNWQNYWASKALQQRAEAQRSMYGPSREDLNENGLSKFLGPAYSILQMLGISPADIPKYIKGLMDWMSGSSNTQQQAQQQQQPQQQTGEKKAATFAVKTAGPTLDALANAMPTVVLSGLGAGSLGALFGLYRYRKNKKSGKTVPKSATSDMLYGFTAGALLGSGVGLVYSAGTDAVRGLSLGTQS